MTRSTLVPVLALPSFVGLLLALAGTGCSVESNSESDALSASSRSFVTVRRDARKCAAPKCGGYFVKDVNRASAERYVSRLDFAHAPDLDADALAAIAGAADGELVLRGKLGPLDAKSNTRSFLVYEAYRGMPGHAPATGDLFFDVTENDPPHQCFTAPCDNLVAKKLNATKTTSYTRTDGDLGGFIDAAWLEHRVESGGAIVAGSFHDGDLFPGGPESVLEASQVFLRLPERVGPCPALAIPNCAATGQVPSFTHTPDRCITFDACVTPGVCPQFLPSCGADYTLVSWAGGAHGCQQHACEPSFLTPAD